MKNLGLAMTCAAFALGSCSTAGITPAGTLFSEQHPEAALYDASRDASADVDAALARAAAADRLVLIVLGANWCHDSLAFAGWTRQPRFRDLVARHYELVFVNVGRPQTKDGHNLDIARRFGIEIEGTPTVLIVAPDGELRNADSAKSWRNAASRSEDAIYAELQSFTVD